MKKSLKANKQVDLIEFLEIKGLNDVEKNNLRKKLEANIGEYILLRLLNELPNAVDEKLKEVKITDIRDLERFLKLHVPDYKSLIKKFLLEFKKQYKNV